MYKNQLIAIVLVLFIIVPCVGYAREYTTQEIRAIIDGFHTEALRLKFLGRYDEARAIFEKILLVEPDNPNATFDLGTVYLSEKRYKEALSYYRKARRLGLDAEIDYGYNFNSALCYAGLGYNKAAIHCLERCLKLKSDSQDASAFLKLVQDAYRNGRKLKLGPIGDRF